MTDATPPARRRARRAWHARWGFGALAVLFLVIGAVGVVLPGLPTTPFVLLAAAAAARGSPRLLRRLRGHPRFGRTVRDWQRAGLVPRRAKVLASVGMVVGTATLAWLVHPWWVSAAVGGVSLVAAVWLWRRPEPGLRPRARRSVE